MPSGRSEQAKRQQIAFAITGTGLLAGLGLHTAGLLSLPVAACSALLAALLSAAYVLRPRLAHVTASPGRDGRRRG